MFNRNYYARKQQVKRAGIGVEFRKENALTNDEIMQVAPSVFARQPYEKCSDKYIYIPTYEILEALEKEGFLPYSVWQSRTRIEDKRNYTKHMIKFRQEGSIYNKKGDTIMEFSLLNSHDTSSANIMEYNALRCVCNNGMVIGDNTLQNTRIMHKGDVKINIVENAYNMVKNFGKVTEAIDTFKSIQLNKDEQEIFAHSALLVRYGDDEKPVSEQQLLTARRNEDKENTLYNTYNRIQENISKGGLSTKTKNGNRTSTRAINSIDNYNRYNKALWNLTVEMAKIKSKIA